MVEELRKINGGENAEITAPELNRSITFEEVHDVLRHLKYGTSPGDDGIVPELLMKGGIGLEMALTKLFNFLWDGVLWPEAWRRAHLFPLYKKDGSHLNPGNYRNLAMMSVVAKCFETVLNNRLQSWAERMCSISDLQGGFRKERSTLDQIWILREIIAERKENGKPSYITFIDVRKAYDRVWRAGLWKKLFDKGVRGKCLDVLQEMYRNVYRAVLVNDTKTDWFNVEAGVPQGAVLSPFLYSAYIDGLHQALRDHGLGVMVHGRLVSLLLYADDIVLLADSPEEMRKMHSVVDEYAKKWRFTTNHTKSNVVVIGSRKQRDEVSAQTWSLGGQTIKVVGEYKYLGTEMGKVGPGMWNTALARFHKEATNMSNLITWVTRGKAGLRPSAAVQIGSRLAGPFWSMPVNFGKVV